MGSPALFLEQKIAPPQSGVLKSRSLQSRAPLQEQRALLHEKFDVPEEGFLTVPGCRVAMLKA
jgi:hypothetical protein